MFPTVASKCKFRQSFRFATPAAVILLTLNSGWTRNTRGFSRSCAKVLGDKGTNEMARQTQRRDYHTNSAFENIIIIRLHCYLAAASSARSYRVHDTGKAPATPAPKHHKSTVNRIVSFPCLQTKCTVGESSAQMQIGLPWNIASRNKAAPRSKLADAERGERRAF